MRGYIIHVHVISRLSLIYSVCRWGLNSFTYMYVCVDSSQTVLEHTNPSIHIYAVQHVAILVWQKKFCCTVFLVRGVLAKYMYMYVALFHFHNHYQCCTCTYLDFYCRGCPTTLLPMCVRRWLVTSLTFCTRGQSRSKNCSLSWSTRSVTPSRRLLPKSFYLFSNYVSERLINIMCSALFVYVYVLVHVHKTVQWHARLHPYLSCNVHVMQHTYIRIFLK